MSVPILVLSSAWEATKAVRLANITTELGDGYSQDMLLGTQPEIVEWNIKSPALSTSQLNSAISQLSTFQGITSFSWSPDNGLNIPYENFFCDKWSVNPLGVNAYEISGTFTRDINSQCLAYATNIDESVILNMISGAIQWTSNYTRASLPSISNENGVTSNAFQSVAGRGGYFPPSSGTSEGQALMVYGLLKARSILPTSGSYGGILAATSKTTAYNLALLYSDALINYFYGTEIPATLSLATSQKWLPHWLVNSKEAFISKGKNAANGKFINMGYFDVAVSFVNGQGTISSGGATNGEKLSDVYRVYSTNGKLLWQNVYAPVVQGTEYGVSYWVSNPQLLGSRFRVYPSTASSSGTPPTPTNEAPGFIQLTTGFTGTAIVVYSALVGSVVNKNDRLEAFPMWRPTQSTPTTERNHALDVSAWLDDTFNELLTATGDSKWIRAIAANKYSTEQVAVVANDSFLFKIDTTLTPSDAFSYPGTQLVVSNNSTGGSATRLADGWVQASINNGSELFPVAELQNFAVALQIQNGVTIDVDLSNSQSTIMEVYVSLSRIASDFSKNYTFYLPVQAGVNVTKSIKPDELVKWTNNTQWHSTIADDPIYTYSGSGGSVSFTRQLKSVLGFERLVSTVSLSNGGGGFGGAGFVLFNQGNKIPPIYYAYGNSTNARLKLVDSSGQTFQWDLPNPGIDVYSLFSPEFSNALLGSDQTPSDGLIQNIEVLTVGNSTVTLHVWYLGSSPEILPYPCISYKGAITSRVDTAHTFKIGNFRGNGSPLGVLTGNPGVLPFTANLFNQNVDGYRGKPFVAYQSESMWSNWGYPERVQQVLDFKIKSQDAYSQQNVNGTVGYFVQAYNWATWGSGIDSGKVNQYTYIADDPSTDWFGYQSRSVEATAKYWMSNPRDTKAQTIVMRFLGAIDKFYRKNGFNTPPTNAPAINDPVASYVSIHESALLARSALYANIAGGNPSITFRVLKKSLDMLISEYIPVGGSGNGTTNMAGSFAKSQPQFTFGGQNYNEYFGFWHGEILITLAEILALKSQIVYPSCSTSLI